MRKNLILSICFCLVSCSSSSAQEEIPDGDKTSYYWNPVIDYSLPDPIIEGGDGYYYLYATEDIRNLPIHRSKDLINWEWVGTAFTDRTRPDFEPGGGLWAPDINKIGDTYVLYYSMSKYLSICIKYSPDITDVSSFSSFLFPAFLNPLDS